MPIIIDYTTPASGAVAGYHVVQMVTIDYRNSRNFVQLDSYVSEATYSAGKQPVFSQPIEFDEIPTEGMTPLAYAEQKLVAPATDTTSPSAARAAFAGAKIAD